MITHDVRQILNTLLKKSEAGQVKWLDARSAGMNNVMPEDFVVLMPNSSINIFRLPQDKVRLNILDSEGNVAMHATSEDSQQDKELLESILQSARRKAHNVDETLEDIKKMLSIDGVIGETKPRSFPKDEDDIPF